MNYKLGIKYFLNRNLKEHSERVFEGISNGRKKALDNWFKDKWVQVNNIKNSLIALENDDEVELYTKLPGWFKIATPIGGYNPDWAILFNKDGERKMYFVVETKGTKDITQLRPSEQAKIKCGKKHFKALGNDVELEVTNSYEDLKSSI